MAYNKFAISCATGLLAVTLTLAGCGGSDDKAAEAQASKDTEKQSIEQEIERSAKKLADTFTGGDDAVEVVDHNALKDMLPEKIKGLKRTSTSAERRGAMGFNVSQASAEYQSEDGNGVLSLSIDDIGSAGALAKLGLDMLDYEADTENENGFERTGEYRGYRALEKMQKQGGHSLSEMTVFVGERFIIRIDAQDLPYERVRDVADGIDLDALAAMDVPKEAG